MSLRAQDQGFLKFIHENWKESRLHPGGVDNRAFQGLFDSAYDLAADPTANAFYHKVYSLFLLPECKGRRSTRARHGGAKREQLERAAQFRKFRFFVARGDRQQGRLRKSFVDLSVDHKTGAVLPTPEIREAVFQFGSLVLVAMRPGMREKPTEHVLFRIPRSAPREDEYYLSDHSARRLRQAFSLSQYASSFTKRPQPVVRFQNVHKKEPSSGADSRMQVLLLAAGIVPASAGARETHPSA